MRRRALLPAIGLAGVLATLGVVEPATGGERVARVFVLAGQSNMEGQAVVDLDGPDYNDGKGTLAALLRHPDNAARLAWLRGGNGEWRTREDVFVRYAREDQSLLAGPLGIGYTVYGGKHHFGAELAFGKEVGDFFAARGEPVLLVKTAWGGKSLFTDFRPPSASATTDAEGRGVPAPGPYYTRMIAEIEEALAAVPEIVPGATRGALSGFVWWHGWNDGVDPERSVPAYEENLAALVRDVRRDLDAPDLPVVIGELTGPWVDAPESWERLRRAQRQVAEREEFRARARFVGTRAFVRAAEDSPNPGHGHHEFGNAETYLLVGEALGRGMVSLLSGDEPAPTLPLPGPGRSRTGAAQDSPPQAPSKSEVGRVTAHSQGLHGYIGFGHEKLPAGSAYSAGMGFYAAVWSLADQPLADFQIGLPSSWIKPDNSDNTDQPLAPEGTLARTWKERGPTWSTVFQTVEGGLGYWAGNHFRYGPPKFSMNATPQCYDYEVGSPGWSFFYHDEALPDHRLGIAQLSNRLLIPPDALPFQGNPHGEFLGYTWMALPFTDPTTGDPPTGDQSWTCFLSAANFKGPIAFYIPETWSKIGKVCNYPFLHGRGLDARAGIMGGGAMELNTVPRFDSRDAQGTAYSKLPKLQWPVDAEGRAYLVQDVTYYSKAALHDAFKSWRDGGSACSGRFDPQGAWKPTLNTRTTRYDQAGKKMTGVERVFDTRIFEGNVWGLQWFSSDVASNGVFPQYYRHVGDERVAVPMADVPAETGLLTQEFRLADPGTPYTSPTVGAWTQPGPKLGPFTVTLVDGSVATYSWYRFVDQPSFQQYKWTAEKKAKLQAFVEQLHASWPTDRDYMAPPTRGKLVSLDPALLVTPPAGLEVGYVPIVTRQAAIDRRGRRVRSGRIRGRPC